MKINLKDMTRRELEKLRGDIDKAFARIEAAEEKAAQIAAEKKAALIAAKKAAEAHGFSLAELTGEEAPDPAKKRPLKKTDKRGKVAPKYQNPANPDQKWSGRGRAPGWMAEHLEAGGKKEDFAI